MGAGRAVPFKVKSYTWAILRCTGFLRSWGPSMNPFLFFLKARGVWGTPTDRAYACLWVLGPRPGAQKRESREPMGVTEESQVLKEEE